MFKIVSDLSRSGWLALVALVVTGGTANKGLAQSAQAYERANCNASFQSCSGGGSGAPIGDLGGSTAELAVIAAVVLMLVGWSAWRRRGA